MIDTPPRFYKPNDPYYYEVDNLPIEDLIKNCVDLQTQVDSLVSEDIYVVDSWLSVFLSKTDYDARTLFSVPDVAGTPQVGDALMSNGVEWSPTPLHKSITEVFSDLDLVDAEENFLTDSGALTYRFVNGEPKWLAGQTYNSNSAASSWNDFNLQQGSSPSDPDRWYNPECHSPTYSQWAMMLLHDFDANGHGRNGEKWTQRHNSLSNSVHPTGAKSWTSHQDLFAECMRYQSTIPNHKPSATNPFITNEWIATTAAGSLAGPDDMDTFLGLQMMLSSVTWAASFDSKVQDGTDSNGQPIWRSRHEKLNLKNVKDWYVNPNGPGYNYTNSRGFQGTYTAPGGLVIKWGRHVVSWSEDDVRPHDFDVPFKNKCLAAYATCNAPTSSRAHWDNNPPLTAGTFIQVQDFNTSRIRIRLNKVRNTSCFTGYFGIEYCIGYDLAICALWVAIGY